MDTTKPDVSKLKIAVLGAGKMGGILLQAFSEGRAVYAAADRCHGRA